MGYQYNTRHVALQLVWIDNAAVVVVTRNTIHSYAIPYDSNGNASEQTPMHNKHREFIRSGNHLTIPDRNARTHLMY